MALANARVGLHAVARGGGIIVINDAEEANAPNQAALTTYLNVTPATGASAHIKTRRAIADFILQQQDQHVVGNTTHDSGCMVMFVSRGSTSSRSVIVNDADPPTFTSR